MEVSSSISNSEHEPMRTDWLFLSRLIKLLVFISIVVVIDWISARIMRPLFLSQKAGQYKVLNYVIYHGKPEVLILGNSRAQHHYVPEIISDSLKLSCFNAGIDGGHSILLPYALVELVTQRYAPKIIMIELNPDAFTLEKGVYERLSVLLPYKNESPQIKHLLETRNPLEKLKWVSAIYPFNSKIVDLIKLNVPHFAAKYVDYDGYVPLYGVMKETEKIAENGESVEQSEPVIDNNLINALDKIIHICDEKGIALYFVNSPTFHNNRDVKSKPASVYRLTTSMIQHSQAVFLDYSFDTVFLDQNQWFQDVRHLNDNGARKFSSSVSLRIRETLKDRLHGKDFSNHLDDQ